MATTSTGSIHKTTSIQSITAYTLSIQKKKQGNLQPHQSDNTRKGKKRKRLEKQLDEALEHEPPKKKTKYDITTRIWFITWNNYEENSITTLLEIQGLQRYCIQEEIGKQKETPHLQGVLAFKHAKKWSTLNNTTKGKCIWAKCKKVHAARNYCSKLETSTGKIWQKGFRAGIKVRDPLKGKTLYQWQKDVIQLVEGTVNERKINWFWSDKGGIGKSALVKHLVMKQNAMIMGGRVQDALYGITKRVHQGKPPTIVLFDIPRSAMCRISYEAMEMIKNGCFYSSKYESEQCLYNAPHVVVMANVEPDWSQMSKDRWVVRCMDNDVDLKHL